MENENNVLDLGKVVGFSARYWAVAHDGKGNVLRQTYPGPNVLTTYFFNQLMETYNPPYACPIVGTGSGTPSESDTTLANYLGKCNSVELFGAESFIDTPDVNGYLYQRQTYVAHYLPGRLGSGTKNITEAGLAADYISAATGGTAIYSRGLLVDGGGSPTSISYDATNEYLDVYWELTRWVKAETTATVSLNIMGTPTNHDFVIRPSNWRQQASAANSSWLMPSTDVNGIGVSSMIVNPDGNGTYNSATYACSGPIGTPLQYPTGTVYARSSSVKQVFSANKQRDWIVKWGPAAGNVSGGIGAFKFDGADSGNNGVGPVFQMSVNPKIAKTSKRAFSITIRYTMGNK